MSTSQSQSVVTRGADIRKTFLEFYAQRGHAILPSASLVPEDPTVLLTIAGMLQFKPIFLGQRQAEVDRATTSQKCIRTNDIENVGRTARHHTFFEMLGNFSFGDYFKEQAIAWAWELSTKVFQLPAERLVVSVFREDDEAFAIWRDQIGVPAYRIQRMDEADNFWTSGPTGPCGPCSEIYYDFHPERGDDNIDLEDDSRFIEFYNLVFMQYNRDAEGNLTPLQKQNIDTGLGLERLAQILQSKPNNYETDLIFPIIQTAAEIADLPYDQADEAQKTAYKVIGDHVRASTHMIADGILPENVGRGYILRRLIRRVVRSGRQVGIDKPFVVPVAESAIALMADAYPNLQERQSVIIRTLAGEEQQFLNTLRIGGKSFDDEIAKLKQVGRTEIPGEVAFYLFATKGFPVELTQEMAEEIGFTVDMAAYQQAVKEHEAISGQGREDIDLTQQSDLKKLSTRTAATSFLGFTAASSTALITDLFVDEQATEAAAAGDAVQVVLDQTPFFAESGGQIGDRGYLMGEELIVRIEDVQKVGTTFVHFGQVERGQIAQGDAVTAQIDRACRRRAQANHTATHLLQSALKKLVDDDIAQAGSLVAFDRLRFDFSFSRALTLDELKQVETQVNTWIAEDHKVVIAIMPIKEAKAKGALAMFGQKYGEMVRVVDFPGVSMELCGGTHVVGTAEIGVFKIVSESGISAGVRRIEAVAGSSVLDYLNVRDVVVRDLSERFKVKPEEVPDRITSLQTELKTAQKELEALKSELAVVQSDQLVNEAEVVGDLKVLVAELSSVAPDALKTAAERLLQKLGTGAVVLGSVPEAGKVSLVAAFSPQVIEQKLQAGKFIGAIAKLCGGGGGGRPNLAQAGGRDASKLPTALATAKQQLLDGLK
ncbi:MAG: alanine--tRNA ligase [Cyanobacteria bacterium P01_C01_bin.70]